MDNGTKGPIISDSGGVSKADDKQMLWVSPIIKMEELETPVILMFPTDKSLFTTENIILDGTSRAERNIFDERQNGLVNIIFNLIYSCFH